MKLFCYGTLKRGFPLNEHLSDHQFIGEARTTSGYILYDLGWFPGMVKTGKKSVSGELWEVDNFNWLDTVEGPYFRRQRIKLQAPYENEEVEAYLYLGRDTADCRKCQSWEKHV